MNATPGFALATVFLIEFGAQTLAQPLSGAITPEQSAKIKEYVVKERIRHVTAKERITVGAMVPAHLELRVIPADGGRSVSKYRYVYYNNRVLLVEPSSRRVVHVID